MRCVNGIGSLVHWRGTCGSQRGIHYDQFLTATAKNREPSPIRELALLTRQPGMLSLAGGMPNPDTFPFKSITFEVPCQQSVVLNNNQDCQSLSLSSSELNSALQYGPSKGVTVLCDSLKVLHESLHAVPFSDWDLIIGTGSQDIMARAFDSILEDGDTVIVEAPTYSGTLAYLKARRVNIVSVNMDADGMLVDELEHVLANTKTKIKMLYVIPHAQNPSGTSYSVKRKQEIYQLVCKHNLLLFEDDPYYMLDPNRVSSFQSMDTEARVIRSDSFSKTLSSGLRLGYATAHTDLIRRLELNMQATCLHTSGVSQMLLYKLLDYWGHSTFLQHIDNVCSLYTQRQKLFEHALDKHLSDHCQWNKPDGGMFFWLKLLHIDDTQHLIKYKAQEANVLLLPGNVFYVDERALKCAYVRASFSIIAPCDMDTAVQRFAKTIVDTY